jgi:hypothetical protein
MGWFSSGSTCDGSKEWKCYYEAWNPPYDQWCRDMDEGCPSSDDGGALIKAEPSGGGGGGW